MERRQIEGLIAFIIFLWSCANYILFENKCKGIDGFFPLLIGAGIQTIIAMLMAL